MASFSVYSIGRSSKVDIQLDDPSISRNHAELVVTADGKYYLTDCSSSGGTYLMSGAEKSQIKQSFLKPEDVVGLGEFQISVQQLAAMVDDAAAAGNSDSGKNKKKTASDPTDELPDGPVRRDPKSGEIISSKD